MGIETAKAEIHGDLFLKGCPKWRDLLVDSWPIFPQNLSLLCLGNLGLYCILCTGFGYVMVVVVMVHETENETNH